MLGVKFVFVGKMKERHYKDAFSEYLKRLGAYCRAEVTEIQEAKLPQNPSEAEMKKALSKEAADILKQVPDGAFAVALCVEGKELSSEELAATIKERKNSGNPHICFIIGGSRGLGDEVKARGDLRLSMSRMTFPHHLARVMLIEQVYRALTIDAGTDYHK